MYELIIFTFSYSQTINKCNFFVWICGMCNKIKKRKKKQYKTLKIKNMVTIIGFTDSVIIIILSLTLPTTL